MENKKQKIEDVRKELDKRFGKGITIMGNERQDVPIICSSGSIKLDSAIGVGGIPRGRIIEIYGPEASGKTTTALSIVAEAQDEGEYCAFIDAEHALDPIWATNIGVNMNSLLLSQPDCGEDALEIVEALVRTKSMGIIVIDSVAALVPRAEIEGEMGDSHMGLQARLMSQAMRKLTAIISKSNCTVIFINQIRMKIGVMFGNPETTTGGEALKFYASIRLEVRRQLGKSEKNDIDGMTQAAITVKIVKNKVAPPFKKVELFIMTGTDDVYGYDTISEVFDLGVDYDIIEKSGNTYSYKSERLEVGKAKVIQFLRNSPEIITEISDLITKKVFEENEPVIGSFTDEMKENKNQLDKVVEAMQDVVSEVINTKEIIKKKRKKKDDEKKDDTIK